MISKFKTWNLLLIASLISFSPFSLTIVNAKTTSVVTFNSEYGLILIDSIHSRAAYDLFESLNVPLQNGSYSQTKIFAPSDKSFRIACTAYGANHICAVIIYPGEYAELNFDTDEIRLKLPGDIAKNYAGTFPEKDNKFHFETEDKRLLIDWSANGLFIKNFRYKTKKRNDQPNPEPEPLPKADPAGKPQNPGIEL